MKKTIFLLVLTIFLVGCAKKSQPVNQNKIQNNNIQNIEEKIIKCQNVIVTTKKTVELFTYSSGKKLFAEYRISSSDEGESYTYKILFDNINLYVWRSTGEGIENDINAFAYQNKLVNLSFNIDISKLDEIRRFGTGGLDGFSGDRICYESDDIYIFDIPKKIVFTEYIDIQNKMDEEKNKIIKICDLALTDSDKQTCQTFLGI